MQLHYNRVDMMSLQAWMSSKYDTEAILGAYNSKCLSYHSFHLIFVLSICYIFVTYSKSGARIQYLCGSMTESWTIISTLQWLVVVEKFICVTSSNNR